MLAGRQRRQGELAVKPWRDRYDHRVDRRIRERRLVPRVAPSPEEALSVVFGATVVPAGIAASDQVRQASEVPAVDGRDEAAPEKSNVKRRHLATPT